MKTNRQTRRHQISGACTLITLAFCILLGESQVAAAQWTTNGNNTTTTNNVGIGTPTPTQSLDVSGRIVTSGTQTLSAAGTGILAIETTVTNNGTTTSGIRMRNTFNGNADIQQALDVAPFFRPSTSISLARGFVSAAFFAPAPGVTVANAHGGDAAVVYWSGDVGTVTNGTVFDVYAPYVFGLRPTKQTGLHIGNQGISGTTTSYGLYVDSQSGSTNNYAAIFEGGNVGIGTTTPNSNYKLDVNGDTNVTGSINVTGNINAKFQDVAEWVRSPEKLPTGTVVVLDSTKSNQVVASSTSYDTRVAGVVSEQPGIALGEKGESKVLVATTGRVRVKVDATHAPIHIGDLLVTSDIPGVAMKSKPVNLGGVQIHRPGTLIGKALEPLAKGSGEILVLLSLQ